MIKNVKLTVGNIMKIIQGGKEEDDNEFLLSVWESGRKMDVRVH